MLEIRELTKRYSGIPVVDGVSFLARPGEVTAYLGPNGSGKSTTVKMITGLIERSEGDVLWKGRPVHEDWEGFKAQLGYVPEEPQLYTYLSGEEYLEMIALLREISPREAAPRIDRFLRLLGLHSDRLTLMSSYSKGMRQKILLAAALLHDPELLILDEPFSGLDVSSGLILRRLITMLAAEGKTVLMNSHEMETVEKVAQRVVILHKGKVVADDSVERLRSLMSLPSLERIFTQLAVEKDPAEVAAELVEAMRR
jgi:ABC-2 type transport system ATP-binding protein